MMGIVKNFSVGEKKLELKKTHDFCAGNKPVLTVVFVHGIASDSGTFNNALQYLEGTTSLKDVRFVAFDLLGSGKSYKSDKLNYDYNDQIVALHNSIAKLKINTPLVLVGHSMGSLIVVRYADTYKKSCKHLILLSLPVYTPEDLKSPELAAGMNLFKKTVNIKNHKILEEKSFNNSMSKIVLNKHNYDCLINLKTHATIIYGEMDQLIGAQNISQALKENSKYLTAIKTPSKHGISSDKYHKIVGILEDVLNETS